ncbi:MAG: sigma-54-dependent Fis family transcriptional regulator, partial [Planctomycetes bacterium]|nr:sigma-54-dependent Fis family transcriptional regulator [Planctomycetota bacterium]
VWRIGAQKQVSVNTRFIFASNQNVEQLVQRKLFREDLFYRINTIVLNLPSLKERQDDIPLLIEHFLKKYATGMQNVELGVGNEKFRIPDSTLRILMDYSSPGNIRELENEIQRICVLHPEAKIITELMLSESIRTCMSTSLSIAKDILTLKEIEQNSIVEALKRCNGNMTKTAGQLGLTRAGLYRKMKRLGIKPSLVTIS